jgi:hypothetical protein
VQTKSTLSNVFSLVAPSKTIQAPDRTDKSLSQRLSGRRSLLSRELYENDQHPELRERKNQSKAP